MAEIEEALDIVEEVGEEVSEEAAEEAAETAAEEEITEEVAEASENVGKLRSSINALKEINWGQVVKTFVKFVAKNVAIGAILWGVTVLLNKAIKKSSGGEKEDVKKKQKKVTALAKLTSDISNCFKNLSHWMEEKKDVTIDVGDDIMVPLPDVFTKYTKPMEKHVDTIYEISKELWKKDDSGKKNFVVPTTDQVNKIIDSSVPIVNGLQDIVTFSNSKKEKYPELGTLPIKQYDVDKINDDVEKIKEMPYA